MNAGLEVSLTNPNRTWIRRLVPVALILLIVLLNEGKQLYELLIRSSSLSTTNTDKNETVLSTGTLSFLSSSKGYNASDVSSEALRFDLLAATVTTASIPSMGPSLMPSPVPTVSQLSTSKPAAVRAMETKVNESEISISNILTKVSSRLFDSGNNVTNTTINASRLSSLVAMGNLPRLSSPFNKTVRTNAFQSSLSKTEVINRAANVPQFPGNTTTKIKGTYSPVNNATISSNRPWLSPSTQKNSKTSISKQQPPTSAKIVDTTKLNSANFHFCTARTVTINSTNETGAIAPIQYQCAGPLYESFADKVHKYVSLSGGAKSWGQRPTPLSGSNKTLLVIGNSHTRQLINAILCQYNHLIEGVRDDGRYIQTIYLQGGVTVVIVQNCPYFYSHQWDKLLQNHTYGRSMQSYDAILLGKFNAKHNPRKKVITSFAKLMLNHSDHYPADQIDFRQIDPPSPEEVAKRFAGPMIMVSMFAQYGQKDFPASAQRAIDYHKKAENRSNIVFLNGRTHISRLGLECGSDDRTIVGTCHEAGESGRPAFDMHRCTGRRGGHADLLAWDVVEALYSLLG